MSTTEPLDPRVAELLSAMLDGAVTDEERATAQAWLDRSAAARAEYESLAAVKAALGGLGEVEPPFGFYDRMLRQGTPRPEVGSAVDRAADQRAGKRRSRWRSPGPVVLSLVASAAAFVFIGGAAAADKPVVPDVDAIAAGTAGGVESLVGDDGPIQVLRQAADAVDWDEMPAGLRLNDGDTEIWQQLEPPNGEERVVVFRDGAVVAVAAEDLEAEELVDEALAQLDEAPADDGILDRVRDAFEGFLDSLSVGD